MTDSFYNDPNFLKKKELKPSNTPVTDAAAFHVTMEEGPTGDLTQEVVPAELARSMENPQQDYEKLKLNTALGEKLIGTRWQRKDQSNVSDSPEPDKYPYNGYTVLMVTNLLHEHPAHPSQVVYKGDNQKYWSLDLSRWPGNLEPETEDNFKKVPHWTKNKDF